MSALALSSSRKIRARLIAPLVLALLAIGCATGYALAGGLDAAVPEREVAAAPVVVSGEPVPPAAETAVVRAPAPGYVPLYRTAAREFGVSWLLLASIHSQETAFSTADDTYRGRNFAGCCAGPMQFNVRDGKPSMWQRFNDAFERAPRPASYPHATATHPSVYDDFDAVMAAASLLQANGATKALDGSAWRAAYSYYGYDANGVDYANEVLARAVTWSRTGFDPETAPDPALVAEYEALYGGYERARLEAAAPKHEKGDRRRRRREDRREGARREEPERRPEPRREPPPTKAPEEPRPEPRDPPKPAPAEARGALPPRSTTVPVPGEAPPPPQ